MSASVMVNGNGQGDGFPFGGIPPRSTRLGGGVVGFDCRTIFKAGLPAIGHPAFPQSVEMLGGSFPGLSAFQHLVNRPKN